MPRIIYLRSTDDLADMVTEAQKVCGLPRGETVRLALRYGLPILVKRLTEELPRNERRA